VAKEGIAGLRHLVELKHSVHAYDSDSPRRPRRRESDAEDLIAVIPVHGTLTMRGDVINSAETRSTAAIADEVRAAVAESRVSSIVLDLDSPGGEVFGVHEAWAALMKARESKTVVAVANAVAASAAYYLASAANRILVTPSGQIGSIGVYGLHVDLSLALEQDGQKWTFISAGKYKVEGNPAEPLSAEARDAWQKEVDAYYAMFVNAVAEGRQVSVDRVHHTFGEGRMVMARDAVERRMADAVGTLGDGIRIAQELARDREYASQRLRANL
jgi:signal peptide peptidase SppA